MNPCCASTTAPIATDRHERQRDVCAWSWFYLSSAWSSDSLLGPMWQPTNLQWWILVIVALFIVIAWPPAEDRSLAFKFVNWAVDPWDELPVLPDQLGFGHWRRSRRRGRARRGRAALRRVVSAGWLDAEATRAEGRNRSVQYVDGASAARGVRCAVGVCRVAIREDEKSSVRRKRCAVSSALCGASSSRSAAACP